MPKSGSSSAKESASRMKSAQGRSSGGSSTADGSFVPTVTAVATAPDLKWMVLSTDISSVRSCRQRKAAQGPQGKQTRSSSSSSNSSSSSHRAPGARRKAPKEELSPEEEERRKVRRERNKLAAAKCRNRRRELTDSLQAETDDLEEEKAALQAEISSLLKEKEQLELLLADHQPHCKIPPQVEEEEDEEADEEKEEKEEGICKAHSQNPSTVLPVPEEGEEKEEHTDVREPPPSSLVHLDKMPSSPLALHQVTTCPPELDAPLCPIISGDSDVLLCSSATLEPYIDLKDVPMEQEDEDDDDDVDLLVPDIDLTASLGLSEWETLYMTMGGSLDPLSPTCCCGGDDDDGVPTAFDFPCMDGEAKTGSDNSKLLVS